MADTNTYQAQANELSQKLWAIANELRGQMDASEFKNYILGVIFYRYLSERTEMYMAERARQNVVFEHGYLIAKLGRERVCALVKQGVQTPGDIAGVVYKPMDSAGAWKTEILREMKSAGVVVDASKLL